jgi:amidohydrolase
MAILCGLAESLSDGDFPGTIYLLFQPAEETGEGAQKMIQDFDFKGLKIDYAFALHNLPAFPKGQVVLKKEIFAAASTGVIIHLKGKPSHASHPEDGINPTMAAMQINQLLFELPQMHTALNEVALITPVGTQIGQKAFGTSASKGSIYATIRTHQNKSLEKLKKLLSEKAQAIAKAAQLEYKIEFVEEFQAVVNHQEAYQIVEQASAQMNRKIVNEVFPWSEDFGQFSSLFPTCFLGLGAGENQAQLHNEDYDFPDDILSEGIQLFKTTLLKSNNE